MEPAWYQHAADLPDPDRVSSTALGAPCRAVGQELFSGHRPMLQALAYRLLGSVHDAEDAVQDAYLRWAGRDPESIGNPAAFLTTVVTRLCLDRLRSAAARRELYVGPWLPEPLDTSLTGRDGDPAAAFDLRESASVGMLLLLERLTPAERAVFVLREAFDMPYAQIAEIIERTPEYCRQLHRRTRRRVAEHAHSRARTRPADPARDARLIEGFLAAAESGDLERLKSMFHEDVVVLTDGGGKVSAALNPIHGADRAARLYAKLFPARYAGSEYTLSSYNYAPALVVRRPTQTFLYIFEVDDDSLITAVYLVSNPDKLTRIAAAPRHGGPAA